MTQTQIAELTNLVQDMMDKNVPQKKIEAVVKLYKKRSAKLTEETSDDVEEQEIETQEVETEEKKTL